MRLPEHHGRGWAHRCALWSWRWLLTRLLLCACTLCSAGYVIDSSSTIFLRPSMWHHFRMSQPLWCRLCEPSGVRFVQVVVTYYQIHPCEPGNSSSGLVIADGLLHYVIGGIVVEVIMESALFLLCLFSFGSNRSFSGQRTVRPSLLSSCIRSSIDMVRSCIGGSGHASALTVLV